VDLPARWITSPGLALWKIKPDERFKNPAEPHPISALTPWYGKIIFALYADDTFENRLTDTGWFDWTARWLIGSSTAGLDMQDDGINRKYGHRRDVWKDQLPSKEDSLTMQDSNRMITLFGYETGGGRNSYLWQNPMYFSRPGGQSGKMLDERFDEWKATKRPLTEEEILTGYWSKIGDLGHSFNVTFLPGGRLVESPLHGTETWEGQWQFLGPVLRVTVGPYELDVIGNKEGNVHSGIETNNGQLHAYFKVIHNAE
jgi:hypothetical protein